MEQVPAVTILIGVVIAAVADVRSFKIPNRLTVPLLFSGMIYHAWQRGGLGLAESILGALIGFSLLLPFFLLGGIGTGTSSC